MKFQTVISNPKELDKDFIKNEIESNKKVSINFSENCYSNKVLSELNNLCSKYSSDFGIRFYGHYYETFDFEILKKIPNVKWLETDCLTDTKNVETITELKYLEKLSFGVLDLQEKEILSSENLKNLKELILGETKTKALNLKYLEDYKKLKYLIIGEHTKNIDSLKYLSNLESLKLYSIKKASLNFINNLINLKTLIITLGGRDNIKEIKKNNIENLEIVWVRGFSDISNISNFKKLKTLKIEDNIKLREIVFDKELPKLKKLKILNCKNLESISGIEKLSSLETLILGRTNLEFNDIIDSDFPKSLDYFGFFNLKTKEDDRYKKIIEAKGFRTT